MSDWFVFKGDNEVRPEAIKDLGNPPPWRDFADPERRTRRAAAYQTREAEKLAVNAALRLRRPLLITGAPGVGKSTLAYAVARELDLGEVLTWRITSRTTLNDGLYAYDAVGRLRQAQIDSLQQKEAAGEETIGKYLRLGPLGTALLPQGPAGRPRVLLIDEIDKSDIDLPNDLLHVLEEGEFAIPELERLDLPEVEVRTWDKQSAKIPEGRVVCDLFPIVILTSNGERSFPKAFLRRCVRLHVKQPSPQELREIVRAHFPADQERYNNLIRSFLDDQGKQGAENLATDQLLNAIFVLGDGVHPSDTHDSLVRTLYKSLNDDE